MCQPRAPLQPVLHSAVIGLWLKEWWLQEGLWGTLARSDVRQQRLFKVIQTQQPYVIDEETQSTEGEGLA